MKSRTALVDLIVTYLSEPTQTRKSKNEKGFTVQTTAQKSVIALLNKSESLHPTIDILNATELHRITSLFIEERLRSSTSATHRSITRRRYSKTTTPVSSTTCLILEKVDTTRAQTK